MSKLRADLAAAVAVSAGVLLATGYLLTFARLTNLGVPAGPVMAALPRGYYIGESARSVLLPFVMVLTLGTAMLFGSAVRVQDNQLPGRRWWSVLGVLVAVYAWAGARVASRLSFVVNHPVGYLAALAGTLTALVALSVFLGYLGRARLDGLPVRSNTDRLKVGGAAVLVICVAGASLFRIIDGFFVPDPFPAAAVYTSRGDCPPVQAKDRNIPGCPVFGYYFGESGNWLYLVQVPDSRLPKFCDLRDRLLLIPKADIRGAVLAKNFDSLPKSPTLPPERSVVRSRGRVEVDLCAAPRGIGRESSNNAPMPNESAHGG